MGEYVFGPTIRDAASATVVDLLLGEMFIDIVGCHEGLRLKIVMLLEMLRSRETSSRPNDTSMYAMVNLFLQMTEWDRGSRAVGISNHDLSRRTRIIDDRSDDSALCTASVRLDGELDLVAG